MTSFATELLGTIRNWPILVCSFVARQVTSSTRPSWPPMLTHWPTRNGFSIWMASPAKRLPSVSCRANPTTTAPTAEVASSCSRMMRVAMTPNSTSTTASCTMAGMRSEGRDAFHGLTTRATTAVSSASTSVRRASPATST